MARIIFISLIFFCLEKGFSQPYDLIIKNGTLYTGSGSKAFIQASIAIKGNRIVKIAPKIKSFSKRIIDAKGHIVSPGFIDLHAHLEPLTLDPEAKSHVMQGVTTALGGPDGGGPLPLADYFKELEALGIGMNVGYLVGHNSVRNEIMGMENRAPTDDEMEKMKLLIDANMKAGAFGISTGLKYLPGSFSNVDEVIELSKIASKNGGIYTSHLREEGLGLIDGVKEAILISREANIPVVLTHHKAIGIPMWGASKLTLALVDSARQKNLDIMMDQYPYTASFTGIGVLIPSWALEKNKNIDFAARIANPVLRDSIRKGIVFNLLNDRGGGDLKKIQFGQFGWKPHLEGKTLYDWAILEKLEPNMENGADLVIQAQLHQGAGCIFHVISEEDVRRIMQHPMTMIASDGRLSEPGKGHPHPRAYGTFPRVLGHYAREEKVITLSQALYKMTYLPAQRMGLKDRGLLKVGNFADITIFNPKTIKDKSTFENPHQYPIGIPFVLVNGKVVVDHGVYKDLRAGMVLKKQ
ncbi:MAG: D-aminoacylase [Bacteroidetes bacterium]|nr:D-aminoacylase [Bacteroidota bacterium]